MIETVILWGIVILCASLLVFVQGIYWFDLCEHKLWLDRHLQKEGIPTPKRGGFWWSLFLWLHRKLLK